MVVQRLLVRNLLKKLNYSFTVKMAQTEYEYQTNGANGGL